MYTYYLCKDNNTIYKLEFLLKTEKIDYYLSLLENYLTELVFREEREEKKLVEKEKIDEEIQDNIKIEDYLILVNKKVITNTDTIEDYLPLLVTIKNKEYSFLRSYTIIMLIRLLARKLKKINNPYINKISKLLKSSNYLDYNLMCNIFMDKFGNIIKERTFDYDSLISLLSNLEVKVIEEYSKNELSAFWQGDEVERLIAESIVNDSIANKDAIKRLGINI